MKRITKTDQTRHVHQIDKLVEQFKTTAIWKDITLPAAEIQRLKDFAEEIQGTTFQRTGVIALFAGLSGKGKIMAAQVIAKIVSLQLYRVDLSQVVSKYIGETEKNLQRIFDRAQEIGGILFFDEADALLDRRSDVEDGHERYANQEISYLFKRMESYMGLSILSSNIKTKIDPALLKRIHFVIQISG